MNDAVEKEATTKKTRKRLTFESWAQSQGDAFALAARTISPENRAKIMAAEREGTRAAKIRARINRMEDKIARLKLEFDKASQANEAIDVAVAVIRRIEQAIKGEQGSC